jgi:hypothetical protein
MIAECLRAAIKLKAVLQSPLQLTADLKGSKLSSHRCDEMKYSANGRSKRNEGKRSSPDTVNGEWATEGQT